MGDEVGDTGKTLEAKRHNESYVRVTYKKNLLIQAIEVLEKTRGYHLKTWDDRELHRSHASSINTVHWLIQLMGCMGYSIWRMNSTIFIRSVITMWFIYFCRKLSNAELLPRDGQTMDKRWEDFFQTEIILDVLKLSWVKVRKLWWTVS